MNPVLTRSGRQVDLRAPSPDAIFLPDIAIALARLPRFNGHTLMPWSGADHSLLVLELLDFEYPNAPPALRLAALLHDGHEAFVGDIITPLAWEIEARAPLPANVIAEIKRDLDRAIAARFRLDPQSFRHPAVRSADALALSAEAHALMPPAALAWPELRPLPHDAPSVRTPAQPGAAGRFIEAARRLDALRGSVHLHPEDFYA